MRAALINEATGEVENVIELPDDYDAKNENAYIPPEEFRLELNAPAEAEIGGMLKGDSWQPPPQAEPPQDQSVAERLAAVEEELAAMKQRTAETVVSSPDAIKIRDAVVGNE